MMDLPRGCGDRVLFGVPISIMLILGVGGLAGVWFEWEPQGLGETIGRFAALEVLFLLNIMLGLSLLWCLFTPAWVERALSRREKLFKAVVTIVILSGLAGILYFSAMRA